MARGSRWRGGRGAVIGVRRDGCAGSWRPTPHLTSPLEGVSCKMPDFGGSADLALSGRHPRVGPRSAILQETPGRGEG